MVDASREIVDCLKYFLLYVVVAVVVHLALVTAVSCFTANASAPTMEDMISTAREDSQCIVLDGFIILRLEVP